MSVTITGEHDARTIEQLKACMTGSAVAGALLADGHVGYSMPIGGVIAYTDHVSPSGVGYDIGCGNKAMKLDLQHEDVVAEMPRIMDEVVKRISFGMGRHNNEPVDHQVLDQIRDANFAPQRQLLDLAAKQLGTVGAGNHYVDIFYDEEGYVWVGAHFGSRGFGHKTASGFLALNEGKRFEEHATEGEMFSPPILFGTDTDLGQSYLEAMFLGGEYAYAGRDVVCGKVWEILGEPEILDRVHNHHNYAWREKLPGGEYAWVVRKGATPAAHGQRGFVGSTMGEDSVILQGVAGEQSDSLLRSTVHGAGRAMSRTEAAGKSRKRWTCNNRDCDWFQGQGQHKPDDGRCPTCGSAIGKTMVKMTEGRVDFEAAQYDLISRGIELRGAAADEAPLAYKRLPEVLAYHEGTVNILHVLRPIGVAMAGPDTIDEFKD